LGNNIGKKGGRKNGGGGFLHNLNSVGRMSCVKGKQVTRKGGGVNMKKPVPCGHRLGKTSKRVPGGVKRYGESLLTSQVKKGGGGRQALNRFSGKQGPNRGRKKYKRGRRKVHC